MAAKRSGAGAKKKAAKSGAAPAKAAKKTSKRAPAVSRATKAKRATKAPTAKARGVTKQEARAKVLAARMPLVHYPANDSFEDWTDGPKRWPGLQSKKARGATYPGTHFGRLRGEHVFFYAGPPCYFRPNGSGNVVLYFDPAAAEQRRGGALPFDSGSLEPSSDTDPRPKLQPWRSRNVPTNECWKIIDDRRCGLGDWRRDFERWLVASYDDPDRYVETTADRWAAGEPDRLNPPELLAHNGTRGRELYAGDCADRRAWTWELHVEDEVAWSAVRLVHVPYRLLGKARDWAREVEARERTLPKVKALRYDAGVAAPLHDALYLDAGRVLQDMIGK